MSHWFNGLVGAWYPSFQNRGDYSTAGSILHDFSGNGNHAELENVDPATGYDYDPVLGRVLDMNDQADRWKVPYSSTLNFTDRLTFVAWTMRRSLNGNYSFVGGQNPNSGWSLFGQDTNQSITSGSGGTWQSPTTAADTNPIDQWNFQALRVAPEGAGTRIWVHANDASANSTFNTLSVASQPVYFAVRSDAPSSPSQGIDGFVGPMLLWNRTLAEAELEALKRDPFLPFRAARRVTWFVLPLAPVRPARLFDDATSSYGRVNGNYNVKPYPVTMGCWFRTDRNATENLMTIAVTAGSSDHHRLDARGTGVGVRARTDDATGWDAAAGGTYSTNTWHHAVAVFARHNLRQVYLDGELVGTNTASRTPTGFAFFRAGNYDGGDVLSGSTYLPTVWQAALTAAEVRQLYYGRDHPFNVRRTSILDCWEVEGLTDNEPNLTNRPWLEIVSPLAEPRTDAPNNIALPRRARLSARAPDVSGNLVAILA